MKLDLKELLNVFRYRKIILGIADAFIVIVAALITNFFLSFFNCSISRSGIIISFILTTFCTICGLMISGAYSKMWRYFSYKDYLSCICGVCLGFIVSNLIVYNFKAKLAPTFTIIHLIISLIGICFFRFLFKNAFVTLTRAGENEGKDKSGLKRTMIIGAGQACRLILAEIRNATRKDEENKTSTVPFKPVCIIDDDIRKIGTEVMGVPIVGTTYEISKYVKQNEIEQIIFAIPSALEEERKSILNTCSATDVPVKVVPFIKDLIFENDSCIMLNNIRDIKVEDLLGREPVTFDNEEVQNFITGKVCMITGGGGSIGSELVRQIAMYKPKQIIIVDIYENNAYQIQQELQMNYGSSLDFVTLIASVRDYDRMNQIFKRYKPQLVFHAAAHKHVPLMENSPMEAIKNNVFGTFNTASLAQAHMVEKFVMISTDKAVNPTNVMGASKRCCEMVVQYLSQKKNSSTVFVTTRFGNVLGSNGSVIPLFKRQIEEGKPVTVTHPDIIRYFMTIPEAVSLVLEAASMAKCGEIFVLDMGEPVKIVTLAENLIRMYGKVPYKDVKIEFVGLRPGEKIKEELLMDEEGLRKTQNKLIFIGSQIEINEESFDKKLHALKYAASLNDESAVVGALHSIVSTFVTPEEFNKNYFKKSNITTNKRTQEGVC
jgi:FlaA1/EpsC-like NDP-sugar epimerase